MIYYVNLSLPEKFTGHLLKAIIKLPVPFIYEIKCERFLRLSEENRVILFLTLQSAIIHFSLTLGRYIPGLVKYIFSRQNGKLYMNCLRTRITRIRADICYGEIAAAHCGQSDIPVRVR